MKRLLDAVKTLDDKSLEYLLAYVESLITIKAHQKRIAEIDQATSPIEPPIQRMPINDSNAFDEEAVEEPRQFTPKQLMIPSPTTIARKQEELLRRKEEKQKKDYLGF